METLNRRYEAASSSTDPEGFIFSEVADDRTPIDPDRVSKVARSARDDCRRHRRARSGPRPARICVHGNRLEGFTS